jgi:hypothetical protein
MDERSEQSSHTVMMGLTQLTISFRSKIGTIVRESIASESTSIFEVASHEAFQPPNSTLEKCREALQVMEQLIDSYQRTGLSGAKVRKPYEMRWEKDREDLTKLNHHTMAIVARDILSHITPSSKQAVLARPAKTEGIKLVAWELLEDIGNNNSHSWGRVAHDQLKAMERILRSVEDKIY